MKNLVNYYLATLSPLILLFGMSQLGFIGAKNLVLFFLFYILVYRTCIDGLRLVAMNLIDKKDIWKLVIPGSRAEFLRELYFDIKTVKR